MKKSHHSKKNSDKKGKKINNCYNINVIERVYLEVQESTMLLEEKTWTSLISEFDEAFRKIEFELHCALNLCIKCKYVINIFGFTYFLLHLTFCMQKGFKNITYSAWKDV